VILTAREVDEADIHGKREMLRRQLRQMGPARHQVIYCPCGRRMILRRAYKCYYCGLWLCSRCAERHFREKHSSHLHPTTEGPNA